MQQAQAPSRKGRAMVFFNLGTKGRTARIIRRAHERRVKKEYIRSLQKQGVSRRGIKTMIVAAALKLFGGGRKADASVG